MSLVKDAYIILYFIADCDGSIDQAEINIIVDFLQRNKGNIDFDASLLVLTLGEMDGQSRVAEYNRALNSFKAASRIEERITLLDFAVNLVSADGVISQVEKDLFHYMAEVFEVDLQKYLADAAAAQGQIPPSPPPESGLNEVKKGNFYAWSLGSRLSLYSVLTASNADPNLCLPYYEQAKMAADILRVLIKPLTGMTNDLTDNYAKVTGYFLNEEGERMAKEMDARYQIQINSDIYPIGVSHFFESAVKLNLLLLIYSPDPSVRSLGEATLSGAINAVKDTSIPQSYFQPLVTAIQTGSSYEMVRDMVSNIDEAIRVFLYQQIEDTKVAV